MVEQKIPATVKLPESLWKKIRTKAIWDGVTVGAIVEAALVAAIAADEQTKVRKRKPNGGDSQ